MKFRPLLLLSSLALLASCANQSAPAISSEAPSAESLSDVSSNESIFSSEASYYWDETIDELLYESVEDYAYAIPRVNAEYYEAENAYQSTYGITYTSIYCTGGDVKKGYDKTYASALKLMGWEIEREESSGYYQGYCRVAYDVVMYTSFASGEYQSVPYFALAVWIQYDKLAYWPGDEIFEITGVELPDPGHPYYALTTLDYFGLENLTIICYPGENGSLSHLDAAAYREQLEEFGGFVFDDSQAAYYAFYAEDEAQTVGISWAYQEEYELLLIMVFPLGQ